MVKVPAEDKVTEPVHTPTVNEVEAEGLIDPKLALRLTEPVNEVAVFPKASTAVTVTAKEVPAVAEFGAATTK